MKAGSKLETQMAAPRVVRCVLGGVLMGLANLVPGISGGTMLLAAGVYPLFIEGVAEVTTLRFKKQTLVPLGAIVAAAAVAIVTGAGVVKGLVIDHRWVMYSLFIGLTLGGVPVVWRLLRKVTPAAAVACLAGLTVMAAMAMVQPGEAAGSGSGGAAYGMLFTAGIAGTAAMILPGVSGGYLLLILGQYITILTAIDDAKVAALQAGGPNWSVLLSSLHVLIPLGLGVVAGAVGVSNLMRILLARFERATLGFLMGLLFGAVLGLWPFQQGMQPQPGDVIRGRVMTAETIAELAREDFPLQRFSPSGGQIAAAAGLVVIGYLATLGVAEAGRVRRREDFPVEDEAASG